MKRNSSVLWKVQHGLKIEKCGQESNKLLIGEGDKFPYTTRHQGSSKQSVMTKKQAKFTC